MNSLPASVNYAEPIPSLPENSIRYSVALQPVNGAIFPPSSQITFQFPNRGYLIPDSVYLRYKVSHVNGGTASAVLGTPFYTPFQRLETQFGSVTVDSINNYHQVCNVLVNGTMDWAQKYGNYVLDLERRATQQRQKIWMVDQSQRIWLLPQMIFRWLVHCLV
jgi:hypothetical protein